MDNGISVIIPVFNGRQYLSDCIRSVLDQTLAAAEVIIVDDGSEDDTPLVAKSWAPHVRYHRVAHGGPPFARNQGLRLARNKIVAFIDSDDIWLEKKLELQMARLSKEAEPTIVFSYVQQFVSGDLTNEEAARLKCDPTPHAGWFSSTLLMRKSDIEKAGPFDESLQTGEFIEWCSRAQDSGIKPVVIPETVCRRRLHRNNLGRGGTASHGQYIKMLKKIMDRRREKK